MGKRIVTGEVRASFVKVFNPTVNDMSGKEEFSMMLLVPKTDKDTLMKLNNLASEAAREKWGDKIPASMRKPIRDGDVGGPGGVPDSVEPGTGAYAGNYFVNCKSKTKPGVIGPDKMPLSETDFVSGDYCRVSLTAYAYDVNGNKGVAFGLGNVQKTRDGEPLGNNVRAEDEFESLEPEAEQAASPSFI